MARPLHQGFSLYISQESYTLHPQSLEKGSQSSPLIIDRKTGGVKLGDAGSPPPQTEERPKPIFGLMGLISLATTDYLVLITSAKLFGKLLRHPIYLATRFLVLPVATTPLEHPAEKHLLGLLHKHLTEGKFWFSYEWDLTRRLQAQAQSAKSDEGKALWQVADDRFFWNKHMQSRLMHVSTFDGQEEFSSFILPVIYGSFDIRSSTVQGRPVQLALLSRRSRYRAGTRYNTRGVDTNGHAGNFNETEQLLIIPPLPEAAEKQDTTVLSFVQTRGSAPFHWAEIVNLIFVPDLVVMEKPETSSSFKAHFEEQKRIYGPQTVVNLVKGRGREVHIKLAYERLLEEHGKHIGDIDYEYFDMHTETSKDRWYRVDELIERMEPQLKQYGYYKASENSLESPTRVQNGSMRSNCMDCLDRTNLSQTAIAKRVLTLQLRELGILSDEQLVTDEADFMIAFRNMWSDHGNYIATAYTGTGALRTDYTRTGVRTKKGVVVDKMTSLWRYIMNNHHDGIKQDGFDLVTGAWVPRGGPAQTWALIRDKRPLMMRSMSYVWLFGFIMLLASALLPRNSDWSRTYPVLLWTAVFIASTVFIVQNPIYFVTWPTLSPQSTLDALYYEGPGARTGSRARTGGVVKAHVEGDKTIVGEALKAQ
ncbi:hypothetical protein FRC03_011044 [Tulasnella sp. 419]|nr:hypothetical protein FRC02_009847 [Tulasnella sp. 418]KAG8955800.1 hypothetical protein FRC03_011044 [Tulasnella sp. 419]